MNTTNPVDFIDTLQQLYPVLVQTSAGVSAPAAAPGALALNWQHGVAGFGILLLGILGHAHWDKVAAIYRAGTGQGLALYLWIKSERGLFAILKNLLWTRKASPVPAGGTPAGTGGTPVPPKEISPAQPQTSLVENAEKTTKENT